MTDSAFSSVLFGVGRLLPQAVVVFFASYAIWLIGALLLIALWRRRSSFNAFALIAGGAALSYAINAILGMLVPRFRPFVSGLAEPLISTAHLAGSFPSDHAAIAWALAAGYAFLEQSKNAWLFVCLAFLVSVGRVAAGVHFAGDIAAGALVGIVSAFVVRQLYRAKKI